MTAAGADRRRQPAELRRDRRDLRRRSTAWRWGSSWRRRGSPSLGLDGAGRSARLPAATSSTSAPRAEDRHRSLRAAIDWSYDLLAADERAVLRAAAVFAAPADLDAVSAVAGRPPGRSSTRSAGSSTGTCVGARGRVARPLPGAGDDPPVRRRRRRVEGEAEALRERPRRLVPTSPRRPVGTRAGRRAVVRRGGRRARRRPRRAGVGRADRPTRHADRAVAIAGVARRRPVPARSSRRGAAPVRGSGSAEPTTPPNAAGWLRSAAGAAAARNVGGDTVDLLVESAGVALAAGRPDDAAHDLAGAAALQFRAPGIIRRRRSTSRRSSGCSTRRGRCRPGAAPGRGRDRRRRRVDARARTLARADTTERARAARRRGRRSAARSTRRSTS